MMTSSDYTNIINALILVSNALLLFFLLFVLTSLFRRCGEGWRSGVLVFNLFHGSGIYTGSSAFKTFLRRLRLGPWGSEDQGFPSRSSWTRKVAERRLQLVSF